MFLLSKGHFMAISRKGGYKIHTSVSNLAWSIPVHIDSDSDLKEHMRTMIGPQKGHILAISRKGGYRIHPAMSNLAWSIPGHIGYDSGRTNLKDHMRTMFWP